MHSSREECILVLAVTMALLQMVAWIPAPPRLFLRDGEGAAIELLLPEVQELMMSISLRPGLRCTATAKGSMKQQRAALTTFVVLTIAVPLGRCRLFLVFPQLCSLLLQRRPPLLPVSWAVAGPAAEVQARRCLPDLLLHPWRKRMRSMHQTRARLEMAPPNLELWIGG